jgi:hypothetical protein
MDYLQILADEGVCFAVGSDAHDVGRLAAVSMAWQAAEQLGLPEERIWHPPCPPLKGPGAN